ncbi:hypothetical protein [Halobacillus ihumii]|uniref:hypothetical protein n=1 Tax=Halobacillus ihumii TaxID=2686092 RepID=UPI0013CF9DCE|nr:hypothetical protein [Halobacillus ihumii]
MEDKIKMRIILNLLVVTAALIIGLFYFPSEISQFAFIVVIVGGAFSMGLVIPNSKRNFKIVSFISITLMAIISLVLLVWNLSDL